MARDKEKQKAYNKKYHEEHRDSLLPKRRAYSKIWNAKPETKVRHNELSRKSRKRLKEEGITAYGGACECCNETGLEFLTLDHIYGGGTKHRQELAKQGQRNGLGMWAIVKKMGYPKDLFRLLCWNCNWSAHLGDGVCVHKR